MHFLPDVWVPCEECHSRRYNDDVLEVKLHGKSIADVLEMQCGESTELFANYPRILRTLQTLCDVGLDYVTLGQSAPTLSGGEAQRIKLASFLGKGAHKEKALFIFDEPTTGLHFHDILKLLKSFNPLTSAGWNGNFNGSLLTPDDYWYMMKLPNGEIYKGHFSLKI